MNCLGRERNWGSDRWELPGAPAGGVLNLTSPPGQSESTLTLQSLNARKKGRQHVRAGAQALVDILPPSTSPSPAQRSAHPVRLAALCLALAESLRGHVRTPHS